MKIEQVTGYLGGLASAPLGKAIIIATASIFSTSSSLLANAILRSSASYTPYFIRR